MEFEAGKQAIARIYSTADEVAGVGFLVAERYLLTCAHVVQASVGDFTSSGMMGATVPIALPFVTADQRYQTQVVFYDLDATAYGNDIAILRLESAPQLPIQPIQLDPPTYTDAVELQVFGFPKGDELGRNLTAVSRGGVVGGWEQIEDTKQPGLAIEDGFSGAPVWCQVLKAFVGMVVARDKRRPEAKLGFMIPAHKLGKARQCILQQTLFDLLESEQQVLAQQMTLAYEICRPQDWLKPYQTELRQRLEDLALMTSGEFKEPMLVQFAACLLNQGLPDSISRELEDWTRCQKADLNALRVQLQDKQNRQIGVISQGDQPIQPMQPCLLVSVKSRETKAKHYDVSAWLIREVALYDPNTGQGAEKLEIQDLSRYDDAKELNPEEGISDDKIPVLLADYLDQVGQRGIDIQQLTVELILPIALMNAPIDQRSIPVEFGIPQALSKVCHVLIRPHERLDAPRFLGRWQTKWQRLEALLNTQAGLAFVPGTGNLRQIQSRLNADDRVGLHLTRSPSLGNQGELGILIGTGTPIALWVRQDDASADWETQFSCQVFCCLANQDNSEGQVVCCLRSGLADQMGACQSLLLGELPNQVASLRQNAPDLEDETSNFEQSLELGYHLSFVWDNPKRVPPDMTYSLKSL